jgi:hypothetical protein
MVDALTDAGRNEEAASTCEKLPPDSRHREPCALGARVPRKGHEVIQVYEADSANAGLGRR